MLLRRITEHIKDQNWFAIGIDFVIVVVGVFIGIQVSNWNERLGFEKHEEALMRELRSEIVQNIAEVQAKGEAFLIGAASARRVLDTIDRGTAPCANGCWSMLVDLMHASQWQQIMSSWSIYDELRREGLPTDRRVIEMVEKFKTYNHQAALVLSMPPHYRTLVRRLIPIDPAKVSEILANSEIVPTLSEWTSIARVVGTTLTEPQKALGSDILQKIDGEAEK